MGNNLTDRVHNATQPAGTEVAERPRTVADQIIEMKEKFQRAMPRGQEATRLIRDALTCLSATPKLKQCEPQSVLGALMTCAQLGLRVGVLGHAWILPFWDKNFEIAPKKFGAFRAQLVIGYQGYRELAQRSQQISTLVGRTVYSNDEFEVDYGIADNLVHRPVQRGSRGEPIGYYTIVKYTSGGHAFWYMSKEEVQEHRDRYAMAKTKDGVIVGPWRDNFDDMAVKTTFLRLAKWMPKSTELDMAISADERLRLDLSTDGILQGDYIDGEIVDEPEQTGDQA